jgi:hypothetical protein
MSVIASVLELPGLPTSFCRRGEENSINTGGSRLSAESERLGISYEDRDLVVDAHQQHENVLTQRLVLGCAWRKLHVVENPGALLVQHRCKATVPVEYVSQFVEVLDTEWFAAVDANQEIGEFTLATKRQ